MPGLMSNISFPRSLAAFFIGCVSLLATAACSTNPATGERAFTGFMSPEEELQVGRDEHPKLVKAFGGEYADADLAAYITKIGLNLGRLSDAPSLPYSFTVLDDDNINAFALPGGYVYITRGLLALAKDEAELASVLAHEVGHIVARHSAQRYSQTVAANIGLTVLGVLGNAAGLPSELGDVASFGTSAYLQGYSREQELEADMLGVRYLARAGYNPNATITFLKKMRKHSRLEALIAGRSLDSVDHFNLMATHPRTVERIDKAIALAGTVEGPDADRGEVRYLERIDGMIFGDNLKEGVRNDRDFLHPELGVAFTVPPGFTLFNGATQVTARGPDKTLIAFDMASTESLRHTSDPLAYLTRIWAVNLSPQNLERIEINGMPAATTQASVRTNGVTRNARMVVIQERPERLYRFMFLSPRKAVGRYQENFQRTTYSFRRLTPQQAADIQPLRIKIRAIRPGDTAEGLASSMPFPGHRLEWFETLNGLRRGEPLEPGQLVKIVSG
jgi:predicted Zn-dependent protease